MEIDRQRAMTKMRDSVMYGKLGAVCSNLIRMSNSFGETVPEGCANFDKDYQSRTRSDVRHFKRSRQQAAG